MYQIIEEAGNKGTFNFFPSFWPDVQPMVRLHELGLGKTHKN